MGHAVIYKMGYTYNVFLPGLGRSIPVKEIKSRIYRELIKSLYNSENDLFLICLNNIVEHVAPGILQEDLTVIDYYILLLTSRMICINPDIKLTSTCPDTKKEFEHTEQIETIVNKINTANYKKTVTRDGFEVCFSVPKARDIPFLYKESRELEGHNALISSLDTIVIKEKKLSLTSLSFADKAKVAEVLPVLITKEIYSKLAETYKELSEIKLITLVSPFKNKITNQIPISVNIDDIASFMKLIFSDNLGNMYKLLYNLVSLDHFDAEYLDSITPAEQYLFWTYHLERANQQSEEYKKDSGSGSYDGMNLPNMPTGPSEFS